MDKSFSEFTNLYSLSKTLRFELKPVGRTRELLQENNVLIKDEKIENSYLILKPVLDRIHENFITKSLELPEENNKMALDFSKYLELKKQIYSLQKKKSKELDKKKKDSIEMQIKKLTSNSKTKGELEKIEDDLRKIFEKFYEETGKTFFENKIIKDAVEEDDIDNKEDEKKEKGFIKLLKANNLLQYIKKNIDALIKELQNTEIEIWDIGKENLKSDKKVLKEKVKIKLNRENIESALDIFSGFSTYFSGFELNRNNYYEIKEEKSTAVATRIVSDNLPKYCDNLIVFEARKEEYLMIYKILKPTGRIDGKVIKDRNGESKELEEINEILFEISNFNYCLSQNQIEIYNEKIGNANFLINLYNQLKNEETDFSKLKNFKTLFKQIGCRNKANFIKSLKSNAEVYDILANAKLNGQKYFGEEGELSEFINYIKNTNSYEDIFFSEVALNTLSSKYFGNWYELANKLGFRKKEKGEDIIKLPKATRLSELFKVLNEETDFWSERVKKDKSEVVSSNKKNSDRLLDMVFSDVLENTKKFNELANEILKIETDKYQIDSNRERIREWLELPINISRVLKYFAVREKDLNKLGGELDGKVAEFLKVLLNQERSDDLPDWFGWFDLIRNYLTKKVGEDEKENKLKLNFENSTLAGGWDLNKEKENYCTIFKDEKNKKYLAVVATKTDENGKSVYDNTVFQKEFTKGKGKERQVIKNALFDDKGEWEKMEYDFWSDASRMIPKCSVQLKAVIKHFKQSSDDFIIPIGYKVTSGEKFEEELRIRKRHFELNNFVYHKNDLADTKWRHNLTSAQEKNYTKEFQQEYLKLSKNESGYREALKIWIGFCKEFLSKYPKTMKSFKYSFSETEDYESLEEFYYDVDSESYKLEFSKINKSKLQALVEKGKIYLFEIKNQDSNTGKKENHIQNLHTLYWNAIFSNSKNKPKLNGEAELFYRPAVDESKLVKKKDRNEKEIIENFRFSKEKFLFHCPITLNFCLKSSYLNDKVNKEIINGENTCILGIDRGEKHLVYYSLIDQKGQIVVKDGKKMQGSLNVINGVNYKDLLEAKAGKRDEARKNWKTIGNIKNLKDGYISLVVREIVDLAIENNAVIVLEDLNTGFKRGRQKIEKQVYQKLELALAKKLNFLVDKNAKDGELGSVQKALQLTPPVKDYGDIENKKQVGIMLYTRANYTSQTDPITGWRKTIYLQAGSEENIKRQIYENFDEIGFDGKDYYFKYTNPTIKKTWILWSGKNGTSLGRFRNEPVFEGGEKIWEIVEQDPLEILNVVFKNWNKQGNFLSTISRNQISKGKKEIKYEYNESVNLEKFNNHTAWGSLKFAIDLMQQIRNTGTKDEDADFILSPVRDDGGNHFDSRKIDAVVPNGDANGAYNIARKGIMMLKRISSNLEKPDLFIKDSDWDNFATSKF